MKTISDLMHRLIMQTGRELRRCPRPIAYNAYGRIVPTLHMLIGLRFVQNKDLYFVQIGANDGVRADSLHKAIELYKMKGILIEPQPELFSELLSNYSQCNDGLIFLQTAVSNSDTEVTLYRNKPNKENIKDFRTGIASVSQDIFQDIARTCFTTY